MAVCSCCRLFWVVVVACLGAAVAARMHTLCKHTHSHTHTHLNPCSTVCSVQTPLVLSCCFAKAEGCQMPTKKLWHPRSYTYTQYVYARTHSNTHTHSDTDTDKCKQSSIHCLNLNQCQFWHLQRFCFAPFAYFVWPKSGACRPVLSRPVPPVYMYVRFSHPVYVCVCVYFAHKLTYKLILHKAKC